MSKVQHPKSSDEARKLTTSGLVVVKFGAEWCPPCKKIAPVLEELANSQDKYVYVGVDVDECEEFSGESGISSIPDVRLFKDGKEIHKFVGFKNADQLKELYTAHGFC